MLLLIPMFRKQPDSLSYSYLATLPKLAVGVDWTLSNSLKVLGQLLVLGICWGQSQGEEVHGAKQAAPCPVSSLVAG